MTSDCLLISVFYLFLHDVIIVLFWSAEQFYDHIMQKLVKTQIKKQSDVNWRKYGTVSYSFSCMYVTEATQFCVTAGSKLIFKSVQSRELGQSPICCTGGTRHHAPRAHNVRSIPYPYMKVTATYKLCSKFAIVTMVADLSPGQSAS